MTENLFAALAKAQAEIEPAQKDADNPFYHKRYATLASVREAMRKPFGDNGLSLMQIPETIDGHLHLRTILCHSSGEQIECGTLIGEVDIGNPQKAGSAITYFRRYALAAIAQVAADSDDDGEAAAADSRKQPPKKQGNQQPLRQAEKPKQPPKQPHVDSKLPHEIKLLGSCESVADVGMAADRVRADVKAKRPGYEWSADESGTYKAALDSRKAVLAAHPGNQPSEGDVRTEGESDNADDKTPPPEPPDAAHGEE